jgi:hypothetical protein
MMRAHPEGFRDFAKQFECHATFLIYLTPQHPGTIAETSLAYQRRCSTFRRWIQCCRQRLLYYPCRGGEHPLERAHAAVKGLTSFGCAVYGAGAGLLTTGSKAYAARATRSSSSAARGKTRVRPIVTLRTRLSRTSFSRVPGGFPRTGIRPQGVAPPGG